MPNELAALKEAERLAKALLGRKGVHQACAHEFNPAYRAVPARFAAAHFALSALPPGGDLVAAARAVMSDPPLAPVLVDAHVSAFLFGAWSCVEALVYATNALGCAVDGAHAGEFRDVTSTKALKAVKVDDVLGEQSGTKPSPPLPGYARHFPTLLAAMNARADFVRMLKEQHDTSKHRRSASVGGSSPAIPGLDQFSKDEQLLVMTAVHRQIGWSDILLDATPRLAVGDRTPTKPIRFDDVTRDWRNLVGECSRGFLADVRVHHARL